MPSSYSWGSLREGGGGDGHLFCLVGVGLNSSGDMDLLCWEPVLHVWKDVFYTITLAL